MRKPTTTIPMRTILTPLILAGLLTSQLQAQGLGVVAVSPPERVLDHPFALIAGVFELRDGRVLISDRTEESVVVADLATGRLQPIGRKGSGPAEYRLPSRFSRWRGDSILMVDQGNARLSIIGPDLKIHRSFVVSVPGLPTAVAPRGVDAMGRMIAQVPWWASESYGRHGSDSTPMVRVTVVGRPAEVVTWVQVTADPGPVKRGLPYIPFSPQDGWNVMPDGRIGIVRAADYHVEFLTGDGRVSVRGPANRFDRIPVTETDRIAYTRQFMENSTVGGRAGAGATPSGESPVPPEWLEQREIEKLARDNTFAKEKPPITDAMPLVTPTGELWVERSGPAGAPSMWDVFDENGQMVRRYRFPAGRRLVALGRETAYAIATDEDGLQKLERYRVR